MSIGFLLDVFFSWKITKNSRLFKVFDVRGVIRFEWFELGHLTNEHGGFIRLPMDSRT